MRQRGSKESIELNYGSLYTVVESLERAGLIEAQETERAAGARNEPSTACTTRGARS